MAAVKREERRSSEDKKFAQLAPESIIHLSESIGVSNLNHNISRVLSEDASYRTRELAHICSQFMRHGKRRKLTAEDVSRAMKWYDVQPMYGYGGGDGDVSLQHVPEADIYATEDISVDLPSIALDNTPIDLNPEPSLTATWLSIEGTLIPDCEEGKVLEFPQHNNISPALIQYYSSATATILGDSDAMLKIMLEDIATNSKISCLLPLFVSFVRTGMQKHSDNRVLIPRLLYFLQALFGNRFLNFSPKPYLSHLVTALLSSLIPDRPGKENSNSSNSNISGGKVNGNDAGSGCDSGPHPIPSDLCIDHVHLASHILRQVLERWATPVNQLRAQTHRALRECLRDGKMSSPASHYGALYAMTTLGPLVLEDCLLPQFSDYVASLVERLEACEGGGGGSSSSSNRGKKTISSERQKTTLNTLLGTLAVAVRSVMRYRAHYHSESGLFPAYRLLSEQFGDALCIAPLPTTASSRLPLPAKEIVGRLRIRRFDCSNPRSGGVNGTSEPKSDVPPQQPRKGDAVFSSTHGFGNLADMGLPNDIFEGGSPPTDQLLKQQQLARHHRYTQFKADTTPKKLSPLVRRVFENAQDRTVSRYKTISLTVGPNPWKKDRLQRKTFQTPMRLFDPATKMSLRPCIGKRMSYPRTSERFKQQRLLSGSLETTL